MKRYVKIAALLLALALIAGLCLLANSFLGNPVSWMLAKHSVSRYLATEYPDQSLEVDGVCYSFKTGGYIAHIRSPQSIDTHFGISLNMLGKICGDSYESLVTSGFNTADRLNTGYREMTDELLGSPDFPCPMEFGFGELATLGDQEVGEKSDFGLPISQLELDKRYNLWELGAGYGQLVLYMADSEVTVERAAELALCCRQEFDRAGIPFRRMEMVLRHPQQPDGIREDGSIHVQLDYNELVEG